MENPKTENAIAKIVQRCWEDSKYQARFVAEPNAVLKEAGVDVPKGLEIKVVVNTDSVQHLAIPAKPGSELDEGALDAVVGGAGTPLPTIAAKATFIKRLPATGLGGGTHDPGNACIPYPC